MSLMCGIVGMKICKVVRGQMVKGFGVCSPEKPGQISIVLLENSVYLKEDVKGDVGYGKLFLMRNS